MSSFQINGSDPPDGNPPGSGYKYILPDPTGLNGSGEPVGAAGRPALEISFRFMPADVWTWYAAFCGEDPSVALTSLCCWNPYASAGAGAWETYTTSAIMHRPTYEGFDYGGMSEVVVRFTELE